MKLKVSFSLVMLLLFKQSAKSQVWFPEGVYVNGPPSLITVDNQVITISRAGISVNSSLWQVSISDGKLWAKLPILELNKAAEITDIKQYKGSVYVSGNFTIPNTIYNALVRCQINIKNAQWQGLAKFMKSAQPASITSMDIQNNQLVLGGNFFNIVSGTNDTISHLAKFNGLTDRFGYYFDGCKQKCNPDYPVIDITSNDTIVAISGQFTRIGNHKSLNICRIYKNTVIDTFTTTPKLMEKLALNGTTIYATAGALNDKRIFMITKTFTDIKYNLDSSLHINEILIHDGSLIANGGFILSSSNFRTSIIKLESTKWVDIANNYRNANHISSGRSTLFAVGNPEHPISVWNPNKYVVRFYPNLTLIKVKVFLDSNNNCIMEKNEKPVAKQYIYNKALNRGAFSNENGVAEFLVPQIQTSQTFFIKPLRNHIRSNCADTIRTIAISQGVYYDSIQFPLIRRQNINDIRILLSSPKGAQVIKNKRVTYFITYENVGSNTISGKIQLRKNPLFNKQITEPLAKSINSSTYEWDYKDLQPGEKKLLVYNGYAEDTIFNNDLKFDAMASSYITTGNSQYTADDFDSIPQLVSGMVNPFRKDVFPSPDLNDSVTYLNTADRDLRYQISFSNFTSDTVFYAVVIDTLDLNLDMSYIQETGSNKYYYTEVQTDPNNQYKGILIWHFPNIKLTPNPTGNFEILSSGSYIGFKVVTKPLSNGYFLKNVASVFFDNEYAGITNSVYCTVAINGIDELNNPDNQFKVYPNPSDKDAILVYDFREGDVIKIYNINGQEVYHSGISETTNNKSIDLNGLCSGIYVVQVFTQGQIIQRKMLKL